MVRWRFATTAEASPRILSRVPAYPVWRSSSPSFTPAVSSAAVPTTASGGLHGVGASVERAVFAPGCAGGPAVRRPTRCRSVTVFLATSIRAVPPSPMTRSPPASGGHRRPQIVGKAKRGVTGTRVRHYWADPQILPPTPRFSYEDLVARARLRPRSSFRACAFRVTMSAGCRHPRRTEAHEEVLPVRRRY